MRYMSKTMLKGRVGNKPVLRTAIIKGVPTPVISFRVAIRMGKHTQWHSCSAFEAVAEEIAATFDSGDFVFVEGEIRTRDSNKNNPDKSSEITELWVREASVIAKNSRIPDEPAGQGEDPESQASAASQREAFIPALKEAKRARPGYF